MNNSKKISIFLSPLIAGLIVYLPGVLIFGLEILKGAPFAYLGGVIAILIVRRNEQ